MGGIGDDDVVQPHRHRRRRFGWWIGSGAAFLAAGFGLVALVFFLADQGRPASAADWASVLALPLTYVALVGPGVLWLVRQARTVPSGDRDDTVLIRLRRAVRLQWSAEVGARQLEQPRPLRLRWRSTARPVTMAVSPSGPRQLENQLAGALVQDAADPRSPAVALVEAFAKQPQRQLVVLGQPGAGKTTLVLLYVLAAIDAAGPDDPVPVLLSVAGWDPQERIDDWVLRRLAEDYPHLAGRRDDGLRNLVDDRRVVPVLDGLDEMPRQLLGKALQDLDRAAGSGMRMVLTCRSVEFEAAVRADDGGALSHAAVVEIEPVQADDAAAYLVQREVAGADRWAPVLREMRRDPDGPLASALSTPLMISLARRVYRAPGTNPGELAELPDTDSVEQHLLSRFLPTVYPMPRDAARAERWLAFLAHHLRERVRDPNLQWWHLGQAVPRPVLTMLVTGTVTILGALLGLATGAVLIFTAQVSFAELWWATIEGAVAGCFLGALAGLHAGRAAHPPRHGRPALGFVRSILGDVAAVGLLLFLLAAAGLSLFLLAMYAVAHPAAVALIIQLRTAPEDLMGGGLLLLAPLIGVVIVGIVAVTNGLGAGRTGVPRHSIPRARDALPSLAAGLGIGLLVGLLAGSVMWLQESNSQSAVELGLIIAVLTSVLVGLGRWLSTPVEEAAGSSPESVLRGDRTALLLAAGGVGALIFAVSFMIFWQLDEGNSLTSSLFGAALYGDIAAIVVLFGSGAPWLSYTVVRLWLALWGRLPWQLTRFLRHAHAAGVLRQAGPAYQIRHDLLRTYLASRYRPAARWRFRVVTAADPGGTEPRAAPPRRWRSRWRTIVGVAVTLTMVPAAVTLIEPDTQPWVTLPHSAPVYWLAFQPDGVTLTTVGADFGDVGVSWSLTQWRLPSGQHIVHRTDVVGEIYDGALSHHGTLVTVGDGAVWLWDAAVGQAALLRNPPDILSPPDRCDPDFDSWDSTITSVGISANGGSVVTGSERSLVLWPVATGGEPRTVTCGAAWIFSVAVNPDGTKIAASNRNGAVRMWDMATGAATTLPGLASGASNLVFSANGAVLAASGFGTVQMWQVASSAALPPITTDGYSARLTLTPDGGTVAVYDEEGILRLWDVATGRHIATLPYGAGHITAAAFSPDGNTLATGGEHGVQLWHVPELVAAQS